MVSLKELQVEHQKVTNAKLQRLEREVAAGKENEKEGSEETEVRLRDHVQKDGQRKQYKFNDQIKDWLKAIDKQLSKVLAPPASNKAVAIERAKAELEEGVWEIKSRKKLVRIGDQSELGWQVAEAYES